MADLLSGDTFFLRINRIKPDMGVDGVINILANGYDKSIKILSELLEEYPYNGLICFVLLDALGIYGKEVESLYIENGSNSKMFMQAIEKKAKNSE